MEDRIPYTYLIGWTIHNKWYYGVRFAKGCKPSELWKTYFTSSKHVKRFVEKNGPPNIIEIRKIFNDKDKALLWETKVLTKIDAIKNPKFLNKSINKAMSSEICKKGSDTLKKRKVHPLKGRKNPKLSYLNSLKIGELNPMHTRKGELAPCFGRTGDKHPMFGKKNPNAVEGSKITLECPHCKKVANKGNILRWHFDNCKNKNKKENTYAFME